MRRVALLLLPLVLHASMFDFWHLKTAKKAYEEGNYTRAAEAFARVEKKGDTARYDLANAYYKAGRYKMAKSLYEKIREPSLAFRKWHNLGNCEAMLGHIDAAIEAYEKALKIKEDADTRYNLELLKKMKKRRQQQKKKQKQQEEQNRDQKKQNRKGDEKRNKSKKEGASKPKNEKEQNENRRDAKPSENKEKKGKKEKRSPGNKRSEAKQEQKKKQKKPSENGAEKRKPDTQNALKREAAMRKAATKKEPISDKEVRKYLRMLDRRGVNTLMVPLKTEGARDEELKPW